MLTDTEYRLFYEPSVNAGRIISRQHFMSRVRAAREPGGYQMVRAFVKRLRRKLGEPAVNPRYIFSEPRMDYRLGRDEGSVPADQRQLVLPVKTTIIAGLDGINHPARRCRIDHRPTSWIVEAETYGRKESGDGAGHGRD